MFIVMEFIEGKELRQIVGADDRSPLPIDQIIAYAAPIAEGLKTAHEKGILHRDIKSANIMVTDKGQVKIMDFGLVKIDGGAQLTKDHSTLGTAAYTSPKQARGETIVQTFGRWA
jgi:eukaryotic-like serine/threonine-protein kinase